LPVEVIEHSSEPPNPLAGYRLCLTDIPDCSHLLVIQDDTTVVPNFVPALGEIAAANPDTPVCLFLSRLPRDAATAAQRAVQQGKRYVTLGIRSFMPVVAVLWPRHKAVEFMEWAEANPYFPGNREPRSDDGMCGRWKMSCREIVKATVPSLVEHPDMEPSLIGKRTAWGKDRGRVAQFLAEDAMAYDWSGP
jgi:hypothetical protein